jgi:hypothetical protein
VVARLRLAITRCVRFGHLDGWASAPQPDSRAGNRGSARRSVAARP